MEKLSRRLTNAEYDRLSKPFQKDLEAMFKVFEEIVEDHFEKLEKGDISPSVFITQIEQL